MINKLKKRFIAITMCSVAVVMLLIIGTINIVNYKNVEYSAKMRIDMLERELDGSEEGMFRDKKHMLSPEAPFDTRYFVVVIKNEGNKPEADISHIAAIDSKEATALATELYENNETEGMRGSYAFKRLEIKDGCRYIFLDHSRELDTFYSFLTASAVICILALIAVFVLVTVFSGVAMKPFAESYEKQKRFITDAGHELKTPLSVIKAANEVIELEHGESKWTGSIHNQVNRMSELTNKLIILSKMSESDGLNMSVFSISETLKECVSYFEAVEYSKEKEIRTDIKGDISFEGDEKAIAQLFTLLTDNALKYSPAGSTIDISMQKTGKDVEIVFSNPAEGVPVGNNDVLFDRFYRHDKSRNSEKGGHGIGLSVAKSIVDAHKGKITARSPDGKSFRVRIVF